MDDIMIAFQIKLTFLIIVVCVNITFANQRQDIFFPEERERGIYGQPCETFIKTQGECLPLRQCKEFKNFRQSRSSCSYYNFFPLVCCPVKTSSENLTPLLDNSENGLTTSRLRRQAAADCGVRFNGRLNIMGGKPARLNSWPWMVAIFDEQFGMVSLRCGGVLVSSNHILTAAHCVVDRFGLIPPRKFTVRLGDLNINEDVNDGANPTILKVKNIIVHPEYKASDVVHDIALIELSQSINSTFAVRPICLPTREHKSKVLANLIATVIGWGKTETELPITDFATCKAAYESINVPIRATQFCAGYPEGGKDSCRGDSGGPLMLLDERNNIFHWMIIGIVSTAYGCGEPGYPGIYTRVSSYIEWIEQYVQ